MENVENQGQVNEDAELDSVLEQSISNVKAGKSLESNPGESVDKSADSAVKENTAEDVDKNAGEKTGNSQEAEQKAEHEFRIPNKGDNESDEAYEKRLELYDLVKRRKAAITPEAKQKLSDEIKAAKGDLKKINSSDRFIQQSQKPTQIADEEVDQDLKADRERLRQLGGTTREDLEEIIRETQLAAERKQVLETFVSKVPELKDEDIREVFFDFVDETYNWQGKSGKELATILELARESMFKPSQTIQERVLNGANVQEKVNAMQFPGGSAARKALSQDKQQSINEMVATGMSEEKAAELISDEV